VTETTVRTTRAQRMAMPLAREVVKDLAVEHGACIRPIQLRRTNLDRGGRHRARAMRAHPGACLPVLRGAGQDVEGGAVPGGLAPRGRTRHRTRPGHRRSEVVDRETLRSSAAPRCRRRGRDRHYRLDELLAELDEEITKAGMRGKAAPDRPARRHRSTRRRQDASDLPRRKVSSLADGGQDLYRAGWQDLPPLAVRHADLPVLRACE
jgi:hypothetical protein